jgi:hypothetical protein
MGFGGNLKRPGRDIEATFSAVPRWELNIANVGRKIAIRKK